MAVAQWNQVSPATTPAARTGAGMDFVPLSLGLVMFGGGAPFNSNETWIYDGVDWALQSPANSPTPRSGMELVYDSTRGVAVLYGGLATNISIPPPVSETWEWDGSNWTQVFPTNNAGPRYRYAACFDAVRSRLVMHGGATTQLLGVPNGQTWEYDGTTWTQIATTGTPGPRDRACMAFHAGIGQSVLFGGYDGFSLSDETWLYDGTTWTQVAMTGPKPSARNAAKMVYDPVRDLVVLTGGQDTGPLADTWTFDGTTWTQQPGSTQAIRDHSFAFLPFTQQSIKFGGFAAAPFTLSDETWEFGTGIYGSGCAGSNGTPTYAASSALRLGQNWTVDVDNLNPTFNLAFLAFSSAAAPSPVDLSFLGMPGCSGYLAPDILITATGAAGQASWTWSGVSGPIGAAIWSQAICFDPAANAFGLTVSNPLFATLTN